ncbi:hypothetical protein BABINDRAFT_183126 [Babjeviella inositovora NRRL Y-12698]|uniref:Uncharacterized protein n=1 Tax=Babjeviella inositovora NRRL Y-12698 TaxID=984486 RepID=A0A1E3QGQ6_9ASCO|nr:uncharacterized protein BABINDRAFT_183126 [Babjeviella inositovora NRRL Y-12698]ODQ76885.1 hypothetical protein BABINDRAFT_183126 [Babjeviella inositovora NRRL Y-12698]
MEYELNKSKAVELLEKEYTKDVWNSFPQLAKNGLIEFKRQELNTEWRSNNLSRHYERMRRAEEQAERMLEDEKPERVGYLKSYHRFKSVSLGFHEDSLLLNQPELLVDNRIISFPKSTIISMKERMIETITDAESFTDVERDANSYMYFRVFTNGISSLSTRSISVRLSTIDNDIDKLYTEFYNQIERVKNLQGGYEPIYSTDKSSNTVFYFTSLYYPKPKSVLFWGDDIPTIIFRESFDVFTANDLDINCITQCSDFLESGLECNSLQEIYNYFDNKII